MMTERDKRIKSKILFRDFYLREEANKKQCLILLANAIDDAKARGAGHFILYYIGHGHIGDGGWATYQEDEYSLKDKFDPEEYKKVLEQEKKDIEDKKTEQDKLESNSARRTKNILIDEDVLELFNYK